MYSIEKELKILRQFVKLEHMDNAEGWRCYSEDELSAAEKRLHTKLPPPIREIYLYMADLLIGSNDLRPLELLHWDKDYLAFFENPDADVIVGIKRDDPSNDIYEWEETDPKDIACGELKNAKTHLEYVLQEGGTLYVVEDARRMLREIAQKE